MPRTGAPRSKALARAWRVVAELEDLIDLAALFKQQATHALWHWFCAAIHFERITHEAKALAAQAAGGVGAFPIRPLSATWELTE